MIVTTDILCELASSIVERQWYKTHWESENHSYEADNGDIMYKEEVQDEFNEVLDLIDNILNSDELEDYTHCKGCDTHCKACDIVINIDKDKWQIINDNIFCKDCIKGEYDKV